MPLPASWTATDFSAIASEGETAKARVVIFNLMGPHVSVVCYMF